MKRIEYLDRARFYGMFLVYYTHFIEKLFRVGEVPLALIHWKLACAFLMQFFFFAAGMFWKPAPFSAEVFLKKMKTRLLPSIFLSLLIAPLWYEIGLRKLWKFMMEGGYLLGRPLNTPLWYLICLMSTELLAALIIKYFRTTPARMIFYALVSLCFGYYVLIARADYVAQMTGINPGIWYIDDAFVVLIFFFLGYLARETLAKADAIWGWRLSLILTPVAAFALWNVYQWNIDAWGESTLVLISASQYGNIWYFLLASLIGIVFLLAFSRLFVINAAPMSFIAQNSLIFLGLNGITYHLLDAWFINRVAKQIWLPQTHLEIFVFASAYTLIVLTLFLPIAWSIRRWFPEFTGFAWSPMSLLPPMREWGQTRLGVFLRPFFKHFLILSESEEGNNGRSLS